MAQAGESFITLEEADEVIVAPRTAPKRTVLMVILGLLLVVIATFVIIILISLRNSRTGWEAVLPFLDKNEIQTLQTN